MAISEGMSVGNFRGAASFYKCMFLVCLILFSATVAVLMGSKVCLERKQIRLDGEIAAMDMELATIRAAGLADTNEVARLDAEELQLANSEQLFKDGGDKASVWRADARWSEMGKARVREIWLRRQVLQERLTGYAALQREKTAALTRLKAESTRNVFLQDVCQQRRFKLYGVMLLSGFGIALFAILWHALVQSKINQMLKRMSR